MLRKTAKPILLSVTKVRAAFLARLVGKQQRTQLRPLHQGIQQLLWSYIAILLRTHERKDKIRPQLGVAVVPAEQCTGHLQPSNTKCAMRGKGFVLMGLLIDCNHGQQIYTLDVSALTSFSRRITV
eukprot:6175615-Pleurochrysis_carterae.AAC.1